MRRAAALLVAAVFFLAPAAPCGDPVPRPDAKAGSGKAAPAGDPAIPGAAKRKNLIANGDFEAGGRDGPAGWQRPDGLTSFWAPAPGRKGKCIKIDTDVLVDQFRKREDEMDAARKAGRAPPPPPRKLPTRPPRYDTVAGNDGVHFGSDPIPFDPKKKYLLEVAVRADGPGSPKVWAKGFGIVGEGTEAAERELWKKGLDCNGAGPEWKTFRMVFPRTTAISPKVTRLRLYLYPYWPPATYWFDDVRLVEITEEEAKAFAEEKGLLEKGERPARPDDPPRPKGKAGGAP